jgi:hypothetical protein
VDLTGCSLANDERAPCVTPKRDVALAMTPTVAARTLRVDSSPTRPADDLYPTSSRTKGALRSNAEATMS